MFKNSEVLEEDHTPEQIVCRDEVMDEYVDVLKPIYKGRPPQNAFLYGDTGVGKTAVTKYLIKQLRKDITEKNTDLDEEEQTDLKVVRINCQNLTSKRERTSSYQVAVALVNELRDPEHMIAATGYAPQAIYSMLYDEIDKLGGTVLVILDEVDRIGDDDTILYELPRARDNEKVQAARIGLIGISNDYTFRSNLSPKVRDTLCESEIKFPAYDANQLRRILRMRAENAFHNTRVFSPADPEYNEYASEEQQAADEDVFVSKVMENDVIPLCAAFAMRESSGSARRAIRLLRRSGEIAEGQGTSQITEEYVRQAMEDLEYGDMVDSITDQDAQKQYILAAIANLSEQNATPARVKTIYAAYKRVYSRFEGEPLGQRGMYNHLTKLVMLGFLNQIENNTGRKGGQYYEFEFSDEVGAKKVREAFKRMETTWPKVNISSI
ncbi:Cdc6/Cdc18 family protein [Haladaptatus halobius]|uniref:Cdc6/Cdc18 family protein n=1 Tax=Haladaptatus halobius TaxID=2884875 RepID=UPI001D09A9AB|nr:AAA family ATPase [Haladaptatus halobius]